MIPEKGSTAFDPSIASIGDAGGRSFHYDTTRKSQSKKERKPMQMRPQ